MTHGLSIDACIPYIISEHKWSTLHACQDCVATRRARWARQNGSLHGVCQEGEPGTIAEDAPD